MSDSLPTFNGNAAELSNWKFLATLHLKTNTKFAHDENKIAHLAGHLSGDALEWFKFLRSP
jgi:hypothetical protein